MASLRHHVKRLWHRFAAILAQTSRNRAPDDPCTLPNLAGDVTPFHPLAGHRLTIVAERRYRTLGLVYLCEDGAGGTLTLPVGFTDLGPPVGDRPFSIEALAGLAEVISALKGFDR